MRNARSWDVFCRVVDNYGDAAVCWRLARGLARLAPHVRLWIDEPGVLHELVPAVQAGVARQACGGVEVCRLVEEPFFGAPADVAVDAFGGGLPEVYAHAMAATDPRPLWIVLEYLSAEPWVASHHGLPSPHPHLPLERYFFFPGFGPGSGGLPREPDLDARRTAFHARGVSAGPPLVTLFAYGNPALPALLEAWSEGAERLVAAVPASRVSHEVAAWLGIEEAAGGFTRRGALEVHFLPFLPQDRYDELLWSADWNFVRGEDSFVRAQWAQRPLAWQLYPQEDGAHHAKLEAFLDLYCEDMDDGLAAALRVMHRAWNGAAPAAELKPAWRTLWAGRELLRRHAFAWAARAARSGDLAINLAAFCAQRLK